MHAASHTYSRVGCAARLTHPACDGRARCSDACRTPTRVGCRSLASFCLQRQSLTAEMHAASHTYSRRVRCSICLACDGRSRCSDVCITPTRVGCSAHLLHPACDGRACCAEMHAASHTYSRVGYSLTLLRWLPHITNLIASAARLSRSACERQSSPLRCLPHHKTTRVGRAARLSRSALLPSCPPPALLRSCPPPVTLSAPKL